MTWSDVKQVAWLGDAFVNGPIRGVIVTLHGLGHTWMKNGADYDELEWANNGGLVVFPYYGPWSWMNRNARAFIDDLLTAIYKQYNLPASTPLIIIGGSMGGMSALIYTRYSKHRVAACMATYPVCDFKFHFSERPDLPRTIHDAFRGYGEDIETLFAEHSPLAQAAGMPDIPFLVAHGDKDTSVNKQAHSDKFVAEMRKHGKNIEYIEVPGMGHGDNMPYAVARRRIDFVKQFLKS